MTLARLVTAQRNQGSGAETEFLRSQHRPNDNIAARLETAVNTHFDPFAQSVPHQHLLGLRQAPLPGEARVLDALQGLSACPTVMSTDEDVVRLGLRHPHGY